jgi:hypothetical protein
VRSKISTNAPVLRAVMKRLIVNLVNDEKLAGKIGEDLCRSIPFKLSLMGLDAQATIVYQHSAYLCLEVFVKSLDVRAALNRFTKGFHNVFSIIR